MRKKCLFVGLGALLLVNSGCSTIGQTTLLGAGVGAAAGTGIGLAAQRSPGSALIGAGIGAVLGGAFFFLGAKDQAKKDAFLKASLQGKNNKEDQVPMLTMPDVVCHQVEGKLEDSGTKWIGPHQSCEIKKQSVFSR